MAEGQEQRILICTSYGKDGELAAKTLENVGLSCFICKSIPELVKELKHGAGAVLTVEEALPSGAMKALGTFIAHQPTWSDLPILVLTKPGGDSPWIKGAYDHLGNLTLLERPVRATTLLSAVRSALRARQRQYEIRLADQRKDEFLAMLAHELRNPLAPIGAAAQFIELTHGDPKKVLQGSKIIARQVKHMKGLIDDLLDMARITKGLATLQKENLDIRAVVSDAVEQANPMVQARLHRLDLHLPTEAALVCGDRKRLIQIVVNLLTNAAKYTPNNGHIEATLRAEDSEVEIRVSDNGIGMEPDVVARVFDLFVQAERTSDRAQGGLGLGLALVKGLVALHGGSVTAHSEGLGQGSMFTVRLPRLRQNPAADESATIINSNNAATTAVPLRVMVVDDNADAADTMQMCLSAAGHDVAVEYRATDAIQRAQEIVPDACLIDIGLPEIDGIELARRLRTMPETAPSKLIAVTGYGQEQDRKKSLAAGFDYHLVKPVDANTLLALLAEIKPSPRDMATRSDPR